MSRGLGQIERAILDIVGASDKLFRSDELAELVYKIELHEGNWARNKRHEIVPIIPPAAIVGTRRALRSLVRKGQISGLGAHSGGWRMYANHAFAEKHKKQQEAGFAALRARMRGWR